ncbi:MAG: 4'-phosphopantetheinyl transferase superfamily protein [Gemmatimonadaceae bacterium]|nr:4'-phosphopantetheinyl transferase superfamily protein [Gemmatimonadaceae bacterium]
MNAVGNDLVYLDDPEIAEHHLRPRFVARVCAPGERRRLAGSGEPKALLWSLWAAKEAAYKAAGKMRPGLVFAPRLYEVDGAMSRVRYRDVVMAVRLAMDPLWVHAVAVCGGGDPGRAVTGVQAIPGGRHQSQAVRDLARRGVAAHFGLQEPRLAIERPRDPGARDGLAPPRLLLDGRPSGIDISLSHDGPFAAFAALPQEAFPAASR